MGQMILTKFDTEPTAAEWRRIKVFRMRNPELRRATGIQAEQSYGITMSGDAMANVSGVAYGLLKGDSLVALATAFRHFWGNREPAHFPTVTNIANKHCRGDDENRHFDALRIRWKKALFGGAIEMAVGNMPLSADRVLDLWLNGEVLHTEADQRRDLAKLSELFSTGFTEYAFVDSIMNCSRAIFALDDTLSGLALPDGAV